MSDRPSTLNFWGFFWLGALLVLMIRVIKILELLR